MFPRRKKEVLALSLAHIHDGEEEKILSFNLKLPLNPCRICVKQPTNCCRSMWPCFRQLPPISPALAVAAFSFL